MFRIITPHGTSEKSAIWIHPSRGGSFAGRDQARGIRSEAGAYLVYDAS